MFECLICYEPLNEADTYCKTSCKHTFCVNCINYLMSFDSLIVSIKKHTNCPYCREKINIGLKFFNVKLINCQKFDGKLLLQSKNKVRVMSDNLCSFMEVSKGSCLSWGVILNYIHVYISKNHLYNKESKKVIPDENLIKILHPSFNPEQRELDIRHIIKYTKHNYSSLDLDISPYTKHLQIQEC